MIFPDDYEKKVGFDAIKVLIKDLCYSVSAQKLVDKIQLSSNLERLNQQLSQVEEFVNILQFENHVPFEEYVDLTLILSKYQIEGTFLEIEHLSMLRKNETSVQSWVSFLVNQEDIKYPELKKISQLMFSNIVIIKNIDFILDDKEQIKDTASNELFEIRKELNKKNNKISGKINQIIIQLKKENVINDQTEITIRNGRMVIPMPVANKRKIKGFIHDESASGQTVFIEPAELFELNNEIRELELQEHREIVNILTKFTDFLRPFINDIVQNCRQLTLLDFIRAKARLAIKTNGIKPFIEHDKKMNWIQAIHPLLYLSLQKQNRKVVPLDITIHSEKRILVISGPNAGGKSVCLKTIGLLQYMLQSGLLIPLKHGSQCTIFKNFFIDIGDEQSLENDLSTYSSHLLNMKKLIEMASEETLFLIDEFGAGTEPQIGGAIAESVLEVVNEKKAFGVVTTHYTNLKIFAEHNAGIANASMQYNSIEMKPLFNLVIDIPGSSFAFEIANKIGLQQKVLLKAQEKIGKEQLTFDKQLQQLEAEKIKIDKKTKELANADKFLAEILEKYNTLNKELDESKKFIIQQAKVEAKKIVSEANRIIENTVKQIKEHKAEAEITKTLRNELKTFSDTLQTQELSLLEPPPILLRKKVHKKKASFENTKQDLILDDSEIVSGDLVRIKGQELLGEVIEIKNKQILIGYETSTIKTKLDLVEKIKKNKQNISKNKELNNNFSKKTLNFDLNEKMAQFKATLDIRGTRAEIAESLLRQYLDEAILLNIPEIKIIHGKGDGILRQLLRNLLQTIPEVTKFGDERLELGGSGATIISFR